MRCFYVLSDGLISHEYDDSTLLSAHQGDYFVSRTVTDGHLTRTTPFALHWRKRDGMSASVRETRAFLGCASFF